MTLFSPNLKNEPYPYDTMSRFRFLVRALTRNERIIYSHYLQCVNPTVTGNILGMHEEDVKIDLFRIHKKAGVREYNEFVTPQVLLESETFYDAIGSEESPEDLMLRFDEEYDVIVLCREIFNYKGQKSLYS